MGGEGVEDGAGAVFGGLWSFSGNPCPRIGTWGTRIGGVVQRDGGEHEGLGEEAAADGGLLADGADAEGGEGFGAGDLAVREEEDGGGFGMGFLGFVGVERGGFLEDEGAELVEGADELVGQQRGGADLLPLLVQGGGELEVHGLAGGLALRGDFVEEGLAAGGEEGEDALGFAGVLLGSAGCGVAFLAGLHALVHLAVDAAGVLGVGHKVFVAAAQEEEVEDGVAIALGGGAGGEGAEGFVERFFAEAVGGVDARVGRDMVTRRT